MEEPTTYEALRTKQGDLHTPMTTSHHSNQDKLARPSPAHHPSSETKIPLKLLPPSAFCVTPTVVSNGLTDEKPEQNSHDNNSDDKENQSFMSPADEILSIRKQLRVFEDSKIKLR